MIKLAIIGTNWISIDLIKSAQLVDNIEVIAIYSRTLDKAKQIANEYKIKYCFNNLNEMATSNLIDAVYIASPNSLHFSQAKLFIENNKHVLCEKTICSNVKELEQLIELSKSKNIILMEAIKPKYMPQYSAIKNNLYKIGKIRKLVFNFCQYSSRYDSYKNGELPNIFNTKFSAGALMDLGVYCLNPILDILGVPENIYANAILLKSGVDGAGTILLKYGEIEALVNYSKITNSVMSSEIQGEKGSLIIDKISSPEKIIFHTNNFENEDLSVNQNENFMIYELEAFKDSILNNDLIFRDSTLEHSLNVLKVMDDCRKQIGVKFPSDN